VWKRVRLGSASARAVQRFDCAFIRPTLYWPPVLALFHWRKNETLETGRIRPGAHARATGFRAAESFSRDAAFQPDHSRPDLDDRLHEPQPRLHDLRHAVRN